MGSHSREEVLLVEINVAASEVFAAAAPQTLSLENIPCIIFKYQNIDGLLSF